MIQVTFLGTSANMPTKERNHTTVHVKFLDNQFLFDCGEGTQRQLMKAGISPFKLGAVFVSHLHADHFIGLGGLIQTLAFLERKEELKVFGPKGTKEIIEFYETQGCFEANFPIKTTEIKAGVILDETDFSVSCFPLEHSCPCFGFAFEEKTQPNLDVAKLRKLGIENNPICKQIKADGSATWKGKTIRLEEIVLPRRAGRKIVYAVDSKPVESIAKNAKNADLLICESTFSEELKQKAHDYFHLTAKDAARYAKQAQVKKLALVHFSPRYDDEKVLEKEAKEVFKNTFAVKDLDVIEV